jgi:lipase (class 3)
MDTSTNPTPVNLTLECRLINASIAAYHIKNNKIDPSAPGYAKIGIKQGTVPVCFTKGTDKIDAGYVVETFDNWVFLVFRGTLPPFKGDFLRWVLDWMNDFRLGPTTWMVNGQSFGQAETGFASAVLDLWPQALAALKQINLPAKNGIIVAGHSKGAAASFLAASLLKGQYFPKLLIEVCGFAAPLTTDRTFRDNYNKLGLRPFSVRYQNEYDAVPFLPYLPTWDLLAAAERLSNADNTNVMITDTFRQQAIENDYVPMGILRYITKTCGIEYGQQGETDAWSALEDALLHLRFTEIVDAHSAEGRYLTCVCK